MFIKTSLSLSEKNNVFINVNIMINKTLHIVEVNDCNVTYIFNTKKFKEAISKGKKFHFYLQLDDEGKFIDNESHYSCIYIILKKNILTINTFIMGNKTTSIIKVTSINKNEIYHNTKLIMDILCEGCDEWYGKCMECMCD